MTHSIKDVPASIAAILMDQLDELDTVPWTEEGTDHTVINLTNNEREELNMNIQNKLQEDINKFTARTAAERNRARNERVKLAKKENKMAKFKKHEKFQAVIGGVQLQPATEPVWGMHIVPVWGKTETPDGRKIDVVVDIRPKMDFIQVAKESAFRTIPNMQYVTIDSDDAGVKAQCLWMYLRAVNKKDRAQGLAEEDWRIPVGNLKKGSCVIGVLPKKEWDAFFGCDVRALNLWKVILPIMTPTGIRITPEHSNIKIIRIRILDAMVTPNGYPAHDGDMIMNVIHEFYRHHDLDDNGKPKAGAKVKRINRNWQLRASGRDVNGKVMPAIKAKVYSDQKVYAKFCSDFHFAPEAQDAFITKDNLKTLAWNYKHGDILEISITAMRNVRNKMKDWSSSMGAQCIASSDHVRTRDVLNGHGILDKAAILRDAAELKLEAIVRVMESDQEATWEDALTTPLKCMFARYTNGAWYIPRMHKDTFYARIESFYTDHCVKIRTAKDGFYLQGDDDLDRMENTNEAETGVLQYYINLPKSGKFIDIIHVGDLIDISRDPECGPSNRMTFEVVGFNDSHDCYTMSWQAIYAMYADVDGDTGKYEILIANTSDRKYECIRRPAPGLGKPKSLPAEFPSMAQYLAEHENVGLFVLKAAADTGSLDFTTRQIIEERMYAGNPMTIDELMTLSQLRQDAIDGLKHTDGGVALDAKEDIVKTYGVGGRMSTLKRSPITYRLLRKDAGRRNLAEAKRFIERIRLINDCMPHDTHPYRDFFLSLKGIRTIDKGSEIQDSEWLFNACNNLWTEVKSNHAKNAYRFSLASVTELGNWINGDHKAKTRTYLNSYKNDDIVRRKAFVDMKDAHRAEVKRACIQMFGDDTCPDAIRYQRQLTIFLGTKGFGRGAVTEFDEVAMEEIVRTYGKSGGAMWSMLEEHVLFLAEAINERAVKRGEFPCMNPFMEKIKTSLVKNRIKQAERDLRKANGILEDTEE